MNTYIVLCKIDHFNDATPYLYINLRVDAEREEDVADAVASYDWGFDKMSAGAVTRVHQLLDVNKMRTITVQAKRKPRTRMRRRRRTG